MICLIIGTMYFNKYCIYDTTVNKARGWHLRLHSSYHQRATPPVAASCIWNSLPSSVTSSTSLTVFRGRLKSELFLQCLDPDCV